MHPCCWDDSSKICRRKKGRLFWPIIEASIHKGKSPSPASGYHLCSMDSHNHLDVIGNRLLFVWLHGLSKWSVHICRPAGCYHRYRPCCVQYILFARLLRGSRNQTSLKYPNMIAIITERQRKIISPPY